MYDTDTMREILTSPKAREMVQNISPRYGEAYVFLWLLQVIGLEFDIVSKYFEEYQNQVVPHTATWTLDYWERQYGIVSEPSWSTSRRRENIINKMQGNGPMNPVRLANIASVAAGYPARIKENTGKNKFTLYISATPDMVDETALKEAVNKSKPARLIYDIIYEQYTEGGIYSGGHIRQMKEINLTQAE